MNAEDVDAEFGTGKRRELDTLRELYLLLGKPFDYEQTGRTCSRTELMHLRRQARAEVLSHQRQETEPVWGKALMTSHDEKEGSPPSTGTLLAQTQAIIHTRVGKIRGNVNDCER